MLKFVFQEFLRVLRETEIVNTLKDIALKPQEGFHDVAIKLAWYSRQKEAATDVRQNLHFRNWRLILIN